MATRFSVDASVDIGPDLRQYRRLRQKSRNLSSLTAALKDMMDPQIRKVAGDQNVGTILYP